MNLQATPKPQTPKPKGHDQNMRNFMIRVGFWGIFYCKVSGYILLQGFGVCSTIRFLGKFYYN